MTFPGEPRHATDHLRHSRRRYALRDAGIDEAHAAAIVNTVRDASVDRADLATKADLEALRSELRWMLGFLAALILAMAAKLFGIV